MEDDFNITRTLNVVTDLNADPTGETPIDSVIAEHVRSNTRLVFPEGRYRITSTISRFGEGIHDFAMVAPEQNATFVFDTTSPYWLSVGGKEAYNLHYEGFTHDVAESDSGPRLQLRARDGLVVRNVTHTGLHTGDTGPFQFGVQSPDGRGVIENLRAKTGAPDDTLAVGLFIGKRHTGRLEITNCSLHRFPNNGIYQANGSTGPVIVTGGTYKNNNISNVRVAGRNSVVRNATIAVTGSYAHNERMGTNVRAIRITNGTEMTVDDCDITMGTGAPSDGAIVIENPAGAVTIRNTRITLIGNDIVGIRAQRPQDTSAPQPSVTCTGVQITGRGIDLAANGDDRAGIELVGRPHSQIKQACVQFTRRGRVGVLLKECEESSIVDSQFDVTGKPIIVIDSGGITRQNNQLNAASCARANNSTGRTATTSNATEKRVTTSMTEPTEQPTERNTERNTENTSSG